MRTLPIRHALAGATAAGVWAAVEVPLSRALGTEFTDVQLLGRCSGLGGRRATAAGLAVHLANGAGFGVALGLLGRGGVRDAVVAAEVEGTVLWPLVRVLDPEHFTKRVFVQEALTHGLFGLVLGLGTARGATRTAV